MKFEILGPSCPTSPISALNGRDSCIFEKAFNQYPARKSMVHTQGIWNATTDRPCHQGLQQHLKCRVGNSESSFGVKALMLDDDVLCWPCSLTWPLTGWCGKQYWTDHRASDGPSSQPFKIWIFLHVVLVSHTHQHMQEKTTRLSMFTEQAGLKISQTKTRVMIINVSNPSVVTVDLDTSDLKSENIGLPDELCMLCWSTLGKIESLVLILLLVSIVF